MAFRTTRPLMKKKKLYFPGVLQEKQLKIAHEPERVLRSAGLQALGMVSLPSRLQKAIKHYLSDSSPRLLRRDVAELSACLRAHSSGWPTSGQYARSQPHEKGLSIDGSSESGDNDEDNHSSIDSGLDLVAPYQVMRAHGRGALQYDKNQAAAYVAARMPSSYASLNRVLHEVCRRLPKFQPTSMLDYGSGPGTTFWAAKDVWPHGWQRTAAIEASPAMTFASQALLCGMEDMPSVQYYASLDAASRQLRGDARQFDLVVAAYAVGELDTEEARGAAIRRLWAHTRDMLVVVEAGNPRGWAITQDARMQVLQEEHRRMQKARSKSKKAEGRSSSIGDAQRVAAAGAGAHTVAPCPHDGRCPMEGTPSWCHFGQHVQRSEVQRLAKKVGKAVLRQHEEEKFTFVVLRRGPRPILRAPLERLKAESIDSDVDMVPTLPASPPSGRPKDLAPGEEDKADAPSVQDGVESDVESAEQEVDNMISRVHVQGEEADEKEEEEEEEEEKKSKVEVIAEVSSGWSRIVREPRRRGQHAIVDLCVAKDMRGLRGELQRLTLTKKDGVHVYRLARKSEWGDLWPQ